LNTVDRALAPAVRPGSTAVSPGSAHSGRGSYVGRVAADGSIATFLVPWKTHSFFLIVEGPDHAMWFSGQTRRIGRVTSDGHITAKRQRMSVDALASNGRTMWFTAGQAVGRMRPGRSPRIVRLARHNARTLAPAVMPDGSLWLTFRDDRDEDSSSHSHLAHVTRRGRIAELRFGRSKRPVSPEGLAAGPNGTAWFLDEEHDYVGRVGAG
jgi:streptogramin lyase